MHVYLNIQNKQEAPNQTHDSDTCGKRQENETVSSGQMRLNFISDVLY